MQKTKREIYDLYQELISSVEERKLIVICNWGIKDKCGKQEIATSTSQAIDKLCKKHFDIHKKLCKEYKSFW